MGQVLIRNLDDEVIATFKLKAELNGNSLEQELRGWIQSGAALSHEEQVRAIELHQKRMRELGVRWPEGADPLSALRWGRVDEHRG
jgi:plasmid stability protein